MVLPDVVLKEEVADGGLPSVTAPPALGSERNLSETVRLFGGLGGAGGWLRRRRGVGLGGPNTASSWRIFGVVVRPMVIEHSCKGINYIIVNQPTRYI